MSFLNCLPNFVTLVAKSEPVNIRQWNFSTVSTLCFIFAKIRGKVGRLNPWIRGHTSTCYILYVVERRIRRSRPLDGGSAVNAGVYWWSVACRRIGNDDKTLATWAAAAAAFSVRWRLSIVNCNTAHVPASFRLTAQSLRNGESPPRKLAADSAFVNRRTACTWCRDDRDGNMTARNVRRISVRGINAPLPPEAKKMLKIDYEVVHTEVYLNKYVVSIAPFSTPACPDCSQNIT